MWIIICLILFLDPYIDKWHFVLPTWEDWYLLTAWKVCKYGVIFGPYFPAFGQSKFFDVNPSWKAGVFSKF